MKKHSTLITGNDLRLARLIYGFESQEDLACQLGVSLGTVQRYEAMAEIDAKILGAYEHILQFDIKGVAEKVEFFRYNRDKLEPNYLDKTTSLT